MELITRTLGDICDEVGGVIRTGPFGSQLHESDYRESGVPVVMPKNILDGVISTEDIAYIGEGDANRLSQHRIREGDIVYGRRGDIGRRSLIAGRESGWLCGTGCIRISLSDSVLDPRFLYYYLDQPNIIEWIYNQAIGATLPNLNTAIIRSITIEYPLLPTQRKIAAILSAYDDLIENNTRRIKILEEMAQALYREWFVHFRFPGHEKARMVDSTLGRIPEGGEVDKLETVCGRITDGSHWSPQSVLDGIPMASVKDMNDHGFDIESCRRISEENCLELVRNDCKPLKGDVPIAKDGSYLKHIFMVDEESDLAILSSIAILRPKEKMNPYLLAMYLKEPSLTARMKGYVSGVAAPRIVLKVFRKFEIIIPPESLQKTWWEIAEPLINQCLRLIYKNANLRRTRDLLLPKLISGDVNMQENDIMSEFENDRGR